MIPDAEVVSLICTVLTKLDVGEFTIKVSPVVPRCPYKSVISFDRLITVKF